MIFRTGIFKRHWLQLLLVLVFLVLLAKIWPLALDMNPYSTVLLDRDGKLMGARIASDGQWRFPPADSVPHKFETALLYYEDEYFYFHPGVNPVSIGRALIQNLKAGKVVSGGSTLSMQLAREQQGKASRTLFNKLRELWVALRIELKYSKHSILTFVCAHAPFGGNVVGLEAASWRYFGKTPENLSWAEAATLAVLPNAPSMIHPGRNRDKLWQKRNRLLEKLWHKGEIDSTTCALAKLELLPDKPHKLPDLAPHLLDRMSADHKGERLNSSIAPALQNAVFTILEHHRPYLEANEIHNAAVLILDVKRGEVLVYHGNLPMKAHEDHGNHVDVIRAPRSTGSILKPVLFQSMLAAGELLPASLVPDIPVRIGGFSPMNYNREFDGAVPAREALSRSLNIPAVKMLQEYGVSRFYNVLKSKGMTTLDFPPDHYGLSLILGGAEGTLWDICRIYAAYASVLNHYGMEINVATKSGKLNEISVYQTDRKDWLPMETVRDCGSVWACFEALREVNRPENESGWEAYSDGRKLAWKTGTSFGFRDGWAVGTTPEYVVGVWTGNADGEGRPGLTGIGTAAPILFDIYKMLPATTWFSTPWEDLCKVAVCHQSGYLAGPDCPESDSSYIPLKGLQSAPCAYHRIVHLNPEGTYRVNQNCAGSEGIRQEAWFILPPVMEYYYKTRNPLYRVLPPMKPGCQELTEIKQMEFIFPRETDRILVPNELNGNPGKVVFEVAHRQPGATIYWHLNDQLVKTTRTIHQLAINPGAGTFKLVLTDQNGNRLVKTVTVETDNR